jgi:acyl-CoA thioesterase I
MKAFLFRCHCTVLGMAVFLIGFWASTAAAQNTSTHPAKNRPAAGSTIVVLGDSLSAEYGLKRGSGWVALLEQQLASSAKKTKVVNASISGDTTSGGRSRLPALLKLHKPQVLVIELGGNDALRGLPLNMTQANLQAMTATAQATGAKVLILGMQVPPNYGQDYGQRFADVFVQVAKQQKAALVPFFLKDVADLPDAYRLFQSDHIHPTEAAHPVLLANVWPVLRPLVP